MNQPTLFRELHYGAEPLLIANVWDVPGAKLFEQMGFKAIATSSAALSETLGYADGEKIPFALLLETVQRIKESVNIPVSVDLERGFSEEIHGIVEHIEQLQKIGISGINIEDSDGNTKGLLQPIDRFALKISVISSFIQNQSFPFFVNVRTDAFVHKFPNALDETLTRAREYEAAGAHGLFVPFMVKEEDIRQVVAATRIPVSVFAQPTLPGFQTLASLGIKRISMGTSFYRWLAKQLAAKASQVLQEQSFASLYS